MNTKPRDRRGKKGVNYILALIGSEILYFGPCSLNVSKLSLGLEDKIQN